MPLRVTVMHEVAITGARGGGEKDKTVREKVQDPVSV